MRKSTLCAMAVVAIFCLAYPEQLMAQHEYGYSSLTFDESTGIVHGYSATEPDYYAQTYYYSSVVGQLYDVTDGATHLDSQSNIASGYVSVNTQAEAEAASDYKLHSYHRVRAEYYEPQPEPYYGNRYIDYYGFWFLSGDGYWYLADFFGAGPIKYLDEGNNIIELGETHDLAAAGVPHHLQVFFDYPESTCGGSGRRRILVYKVVDSSNKGVGKASVIEDTGGPIMSSCDGSRVRTTTSCEAIVNEDSRFQDSLSAGCATGGADPNTCGFAIPQNKWKWCAKNGNQVTLAQVNYDVRQNEVKVNGATAALDGKHLYADGTMR